MKKIILVATALPVFFISCDKKTLVNSKVNQRSKIENPQSVSVSIIRRTLLPSYTCIWPGFDCLDDVIVTPNNNKVLTDLSTVASISKVAVRDFVVNETDNSPSVIRDLLGDDIVQKLRDGVYTLIAFDSPNVENKKIFLIGDYDDLTMDNFVLTVPVFFD